jgi:hypothetical protein
VQRTGEPLPHASASSRSSTLCLKKCYAVQIARDWNTRGGGTGYVLRFQIETDYVAKYPIQTTDGRVHREYWIRRKISSTSTGTS